MDSSADDGTVLCFNAVLLCVSLEHNPEWSGGASEIRCGEKWEKKIRSVAGKVSGFGGFTPVRATYLVGQEMCIDGLGWASLGEGREVP